MWKYICIILLTTASIVTAAPKVWVVSFTGDPLIARSMQQSVSDDISTMKVEVAQAPDVAEPVLSQQAKSKNVQYLVSGRVEQIGDNLQLVVKIENLYSKIINVFKANGPKDDIFAIEDSMSKTLKQTNEQPLVLEPPVENPYPFYPYNYPYGYPYNYSYNYPYSYPYSYPYFRRQPFIIITPQREFRNEHRNEIRVEPRREFPHMDRPMENRPPNLVPGPIPVPHPPSLEHRNERKGK